MPLFTSWSGNRYRLPPLKCGHPLYQEGIMLGETIFLCATCRGEQTVIYDAHKRLLPTVPDWPLPPAPQFLADEDCVLKAGDLVVHLGKSMWGISRVQPDDIYDFVHGQKREPMMSDLFGKAWLISRADPLEDA